MTAVLYTARNSTQLSSSDHASSGLYKTTRVTCLFDVSDRFNLWTRYFHRIRPLNEYQTTSVPPAVLEGLLPNQRCKRLKGVTSV